MFDRILWHSPQLWPVALLGAAVLVGALILLYLPQLRPVHRSWRLLLPSLRLSAVLVIAIAILRPVVVRPRTSAEAGAIVLLVDRSRSMNVTDVGRSPAELVSLAEGLDLVQGGARPHLKLDAAAMRAALSTLLSNMILARGELDYARISGQNTDVSLSHLQDVKTAADELAEKLSEIPPAQRLAERLSSLATNVDRAGDEWARELATTGNRLSSTLERAQASADQELYYSDPRIQQVCQQLASSSRSELVKKAVLSPKNGLLDRIGSQAPVFGFSITDSLTALPLRDTTGVIRDFASEPRGRGTDLSGALRSLREKMQGLPVQAIVLFSDGRQVGGDAELTTSVGAAGAPVFAVAVAAPVNKDIAVAGLTAPHSVLAGQSLIVRASVRAVGFPGADVNVRLESDGKSYTQHVRIAPEGTAAAQFPLTFSEAGVHTIRVSLDSRDGEASLDNNALVTHVNVIRQRIRALLVGSGRWDYQYLRNNLSRAPWVDLQEQLCPEAAAKLTTPPSDILARDVVILHDVHAASLSSEQWQAVVKLVTERGGSMILIPADARQLLALSGIAGVAGMLPMRDPQAATWRVWSGDEPAFRFSPPQGESIDAMKLADDPALDRRRWGELPAFFRFMPVIDPKPLVRPLLVERELGLPVLTEARVGAGRAFFFGATETWRWRADLGEKDQDRFWAQLLRYACEEPYAVHDGPIALAADPMVAEPQEPIRVRARFLAEKQYSSVVPTLVISRLSSERPGLLRSQVLLPAGATGGRFETVVDDLPDGDYRFQLALNGVDTQASLTVRIRDTFASEMANISGDEARLRRIAAASGGQLLHLDEVDKLPEKLQQAREGQAQFVEYPLWDSPYLFAIVMGCLCAEWAIRKRLGLP
jgi:hypothetical protein